ncbi:predicted protein [Streptomyces viridochromogenes DSM 40736]|uniref:Predicted protein n=1 Tax=Streptomyces viridochromogenes (strain DSM 40736 / JCM 4977 / BCRC 1201 / Tue 494) TaxID=591159 RepID=D9X191_STRVT|nr:predicted protein [Streptomyces viridochromogenes DSM 40736]
MHGQQGLTGRRGPGHGERLLFSVALVVVSLLWITQDMETWATVLCGVGAAVGALGVFYFGWRYIRARGNSR